jgi:acetyltransferase-like isoleucine patch superfamily enzyme
MIGAGAVILPNVRIGAEAMVAAGAVVRRNVPDRTLVSGNPAVGRSFDPAKASSLRVEDGE